MSASQINAGGAAFKLTLVDDLTRNIQSTINAAVASVQQATIAIDQQVRSIGTSIADSGKRIAAVGAGVGAFGAASGFGFVKATIAAGNFAETVNMFDAVFKKQSNAVREWGRDYASVVGRSEQQLLSFLAEAQDTFVPLGFDRDEAAELSKTVSKLAIDLASFKNIDDGDAMRRLLGGLIGNTENLRAFGVVAGQTQIKAKALSLGFDPKNLTAYQKAMAILELTIEGTADAQGDAIKTAGGFNNTLKRFRSAISSLVVAIGEPLRQIGTVVVGGLAAMVQGIANLLTRFPILSQLAAGVSVVLTALGTALAAVGTAFVFLGGKIATYGILMFAWSKITGVFGTALRGLAIRAIQLGGILSARLAGPLLAAAFSATIGSMIAGITLLSRVIIALSAKMAIALLNPWTAVIVAITIAAKLAERYYNKQEQREKQRGDGLESKRVAIVGQSFKDAGQAVPSDLRKTFDPNNARVVDTSVGGTGEISNQQQQLADEIGKIRTPLQAFRERMADAASLLKRGTIDQSQFDSFKQQETKRFKQNDPATQQRSALVDQLRTPMESFRQAIAEARKAFATEPAMFRRAVESARENFRANDKATQLALQLATPAEKLRTAVAEAHKVFANSPKQLSRALSAARRQFNFADPIQQLKTALATPAEILRARITELNRVLASAPPAIRAALLARGKAEAIDQFKKNDPANRKATSIKEGLKTDGAKIAQQMRQAWELVRRGLLSRADAATFGKKLQTEALGDRPDVKNFEGLGTSNAFVAANLGQFAPAFDPDKESLEFAKKQAKLQKETVDELRQLNRKQVVFN